MFYSAIQAVEDLVNDTIKNNPKEATKEFLAGAEEL